MTKSKMLPFLPEEKSNQASFWSLTKNDGDFSLLNGDRPFNSRPERCNFTRRPTTSETGSRAFSSSRNCGVKRMVLSPRFGAAFEGPGAIDSALYNRPSIDGFLGRSGWAPGWPRNRSLFPDH